MRWVCKILLIAVGLVGIDQSFGRAPVADDSGKWDRGHFATQPSRSDEIEHLRRIVANLCDPKMEGRGIDTFGIKMSAELIRNEFQKAGLKSGPSDGSYFQGFDYLDAGRDKRLHIQNVVGILGEVDQPQADTILLGAHYDHLGFGPTFSLAEEKDRHSLHPGADDNASGIALLLDLARRFAARKLPPHKRLVFIAFSGEEEGNWGSSYYVDHPIFPLASTTTMINFDMVGRVHDGMLGIAGNNSAKELDIILDEAGTHSRLKLLRGGTEYPDDSDHAPFARVRIPILYVCSGSHDDRHRPTDTPDKINFEGMVDIADLMSDVVDVLLRSPHLQFIPRS